MSFQDWSTNPANNTLVGAIDWSEGQLPSTVNGSARQMMADLAGFRDALAGGTFAMTGATYSGTVQANVLQIDGQFYLANASPTARRVNFDVGDYLQYDITNNLLSGFVGGVERLRLSATALNLYVPITSSGAITAGAGVSAGGPIAGTLLTISGAGNFSGQVSTAYSASTVSYSLQSNYVTGALAGSASYDVKNENGINTGSMRFSMTTDGASAWTLQLTPVGGRLSDRRIDTLAVSTADMTYKGEKVWREGNDGAGSGLDADKLDGFEAADFDRITSSNLAQNGGYMVHANGLKECWGIVTVPANSEVTVTLPTAHTTWVNPVVTAAGPRFDYGGLDIIGLAVILSANSFVITSGIGVAQQFTWHSKGV